MGDKIGIATVFTGYNYGSVLQAYATKSLLLKAGYDPEIFKIKGSFKQGRDVRFKKALIIMWHSLIYPNAKKAFKAYNCSYLKKPSVLTVKKFDEFIKQKLKPTLITYKKLSNLAKAKEYKAFLCGSDQIWSGTALYVDPFYYLRFAPRYKRIAFSPSFGRDFVASYNKPKITKYLSGIRFLSVREESGVEIVKELINKKAELLPDPTIMLTAEQWDNELGIKKNTQKNYMLCYFLDEPSDLAKRVIDKISSQKSLKVIFLPFSFYDDSRYNAGPKEFVELLRNAAFVCTDSFHGTAFSLNFKVPFYTFERNYGHDCPQHTRIDCLLKSVNMQERLCVSDEITDKEIDFKFSQQVFAQQRKKALTFLTNSINEVKNNAV